MGYGNHGFSNGGIRHYKDMTNHLERLNEEEVEGVIEAWNCWTCNNNLEVEWKAQFVSDSEEAEADVVTQEHEGVDGELIVAGDDGHSGLSGW